MKVLGIDGSPRRGGNSDALLREILAGAKSAGAEVMAVHLRDYDFSSCIGCERCRKDKACTGVRDGMQLIYPLIEEAGALALVSPTHQYNVSALMKAFIDRLYCYYDFTDDRPRGYSSRLAGGGRVAVAAAICEQPNRKDMGFTLEAMTMPLEALGYRVKGELPVFGIFDKALVKKDPKAMKAARALGEKLARG